MAMAAPHCVRHLECSARSKWLLCLWHRRATRVGLAADPSSEADLLTFERTSSRTKCLGTTRCSTIPG